jgi:hypothetical protein
MWLDVWPHAARMTLGNCSVPTMFLGTTTCVEFETSQIISLAILLTPSFALSVQPALPSFPQSATPGRER